MRYICLDASRVSVSYAASAPHFAPLSDADALKKFAARYKLPERFILTVGRVYHTGHDALDEYPGGNNETLVRGYRNYRANGGSLPLVVAGRDIDRYLKLHGFGQSDLEDIHFTGFIPHDEIVKAYNLAEFFVVATLYESFCLPLIEAMASGCPALVSNTGGCPELGADAARYFDPYQANAIGRGMLELECSAPLRAEMRRKGLQRARMFSWEQTAKTTLAAFEQIMPPIVEANTDQMAGQSQGKLGHAIS